MSFKEVVPAFVNAALVIGVTSAVLAVAWYELELQIAYYSAAELVGITVP